MLLGAASPGWTAGLHADAAIFPVRVPVIDDDLDKVRGGFVLPNGMDVTVGIDIQTLVNGVLALRTVLSTADAGLPIVFTGTGSTPSAAGAPIAAGPGVGVIRVVQGVVSSAPADVGQQRVELVPNGPAMSTPSGTLQLSHDDGGSVVKLSGDSLELHHMIGNLTGTLVANTANNRSINTLVTVNIDLQNSAVQAGNALLRWDSMAVEAAGRGIR